MSMRSQVYEWANLAPAGVTSTLRRTTADLPKALVANREYDLFIGGVGNNITKPAETTATQFIVIEDIACSATLNGAVQIRINTTDYFQNPDVTDMVGIPDWQVLTLVVQAHTACAAAGNNRRSTDFRREPC